LASGERILEEEPKWAVVVITALGATLANCGQLRPSKPVLNSVSASTLAEAGIQLRAPSGSAAIRQATAQQTALQAFPGTSTVRETVLADLSNTHHVPAINTLVWAVSLTVPSGFCPASAGPPPGNRGMRVSYLVVFIDAATGEFIMATSGGQL
jgi:hypothetical protein